MYAHVCVHILQGWSVQKVRDVVLHLHRRQLSRSKGFKQVEVGRPNQKVKQGSQLQDGQ
jgi:hypothetical protein